MFILKKQMCDALVFCLGWVYFSDLQTAIDLHMREVDMCTLQQRQRSNRPLYEGIIISIRGPRVTAFTPTYQRTRAADCQAPHSA